MKIHLAWIRVTAAAAVLAGASTQQSEAQYAPYSSMPQPVAPATQASSTVVPPAASPMGPRYGSQQPYWQQAAQQAQAAPVASSVQYPQTSAAYAPAATAMPAYASTPAYTPAPLAAQAAQTYPQAQPYSPATTYPPAAPYQTAPYQPYPRIAYQQSEAAPAAKADEPMPAPVPPQASANGAATSNAPANGTNGQANGYVHNGQSAPSYMGGCNCSTGMYPAGNYYTGDQACGGGYGLSEYFGDECGYESQWFGGVYYLFMERDRPTPRKLAVVVDDSATFPNYWPHSGWNSLVNSDHDFRSGVEVRFGSTFTFSDGCESCDPGCGDGSYGGYGCNNCGSCNPPTLYAWEFAWWGLDDDENSTEYIDQPTSGLYGMVNFAGLGYDRDGDATIDNPVNGYYGYALPIPAASSEILAQRVCTNFKAQNLELNIIRFPVCNVSCGGGCDTACDPCGREPKCAPMVFSMYGSCGVRYFRAEDEFNYASEFNGGTQPGGFDGWSYNDDNELYYDIEVENQLLGPQLGWTMNYCYSRWNFFANSTFGVFGNHIEHDQRMWSGGGGAVYFYDPATGGTGRQFDVESDKDDIAFLGELRLGGSYDFSCHWRGVLAYRAVAISGIANSTDQIPTDFTNAEWVAIIDSDNSMIVHGLQTGVECRY